MPDEQVRLEDWEEADQATDLSDAIKELSALLSLVEVECARIGARVRRLELRPVISVDYREGL